MSEDNDTASPRAQLEQLNERSRWYATQAWQLPFAYMGLAGIGLAGVIEKAPQLLPWLFLTLSLAGYAILFHMFGLHNGIRDAVRNIRLVESSLKLSKTAAYCPLYAFPLQVFILIVAIMASAASWRSFGCMGQCCIVVVGAAAVITSCILFVKAWPTTEDKQ